MHEACTAHVFPFSSCGAEVVSGAVPPKQSALDLKNWFNPPEGPKILATYIKSRNIKSNIIWFKTSIFNYGTGVGERFPLPTLQKVTTSLSAQAEAPIEKY